MKRALSCILAVLMIITIFSACSGSEEDTTQNSSAIQDTTETTTEATTAPEPAEPVNMNLLTGICDLTEGAYGKRPVAVMINNIKASLPQYGISDADIMFEIVVEGGITRMMAIYGDYTQIPNVCSVRSCRYYFPIFAHGFDAVYCCFGSNITLGTPTLKRIGIDYFDGQTYSKLYARDSARLKSYSTEHTAYLKGSTVPACMAEENYRSDILADKSTPFFNFADENVRVNLSDKKCEKAVLKFSSSYYSTFTYDAASGTYLKQHSGKAHMDSATNTQLAYTNVFVLETDVHNYQGDKIMELDWTGGTGYCLSNGTIKNIIWSKPTEDSPIMFLNTDGSELTINAGKSYIGVIAPDSTDLEIVEPTTSAAATVA